VSSTEGHIRQDFLSRRPAGGEDLIQVCADVSSPETLAREIHALAAASKEYPRAKPRLLVLDRDALFSVAVDSVRMQPAYEWLLAAGAE
jgi:hypothetical protein